MLVGGRYEKVDGGNAATTDPDDAKLVDGSAFVPNVGVSYEIVPGLRPYASYSRAFKGQFASRLASGAKADPERGEQYEIGVKAGLFDNRINTTISAYQLTRSNVLQPDLLSPVSIPLRASNEVVVSSSMVSSWWRRTGRSLPAWRTPMRR